MDAVWFILDFDPRQHQEGSWGVAGQQPVMPCQDIASMWAETKNKQ